ncbi:MAG: hypothetical protein JWO56_2845 [Acidobacteria bacterium]|nr:hypothetical protein [Acidobacteriota bacterium]
MDLYIDAAVRLDVTDRLKDQCPTAQGHVSAGHPGDVQEHELPIVLVAPHETIVEIHGSAGRRIEIQPAQIKILILARPELGAGGRSADEVAEQIAIEVRAALRIESQSAVGIGPRPDPIFPRSKPSDVRLLRSLRVPDKDSPFGLHQHGAILLIYEFKVATPEGQATVALDLA